MVSPTPPLVGPPLPRRRWRRRAVAGQSGSWLASPGQRSPSGGDLGLGGCWKGKARWGYPFRCLLRKLDAACWTSHLSLRHGRKGLRDFVLPASRDSFALRIPPFFPAPLPPSPVRHVCTGIFLASFTGRSARWKGLRCWARRGTPEGLLSLSRFSQLPGCQLSSPGDWQQEAMDFPHRSASSAVVFFFGFVSFACTHV
ncbi:hypothetical protein HJG60_010269 [Phyllostomus discolor]|uniref:Uncharacterized protein n=1 Tax=Phyllostomus discolor TaxID=89673 RepID=A0A834EK67_9CHIR|nr:hypothetical protein HJG60_010269 [Phyllostomus discolor]